MQQFHTITHSFAQRRAAYSSVFSRLRTLLLSIGGGGVSTALFASAVTRGASIHCALTRLRILPVATGVYPLHSSDFCVCGKPAQPPQTSVPSVPLWQSILCFHKRTATQALTYFRTAATSTFSSRKGTSANTPEQRP